MVGGDFHGDSFPKRAYIGRCLKGSSNQSRVDLHAANVQATIEMKGSWKIQEDTGRYSEKQLLI
jgi:hypothetical protein